MSDETNKQYPPYKLLPVVGGKYELLKHWREGAYFGDNFGIGTLDEVQKFIRDNRPAIHLDCNGDVVSDK